MSLYSKTARELSLLLEKREVSSVELTRGYLDRIEKLEPAIHAFITVWREEALAMAQAADARRAGKGGAAGVTPLTGIPIAIKDNMCTRGQRTTCASRMLENFYPPYDATVVARLKQAGAVILGKANMDEFAMGSSTEHSAFQTSLNPWDTTRVPGGSSGGSAAAVAAAMAPWALGSDTGGSIRQPASLSGIVGIKPTYGLVSRYGLVAYGSSLDQIGPMTIDVADSAFLLQAIAGHDPLDSTSHNRPVPEYLEQMKGGVKGLRVGIPREYFVEGMDKEVEAAVRAAIASYEKLGATIVEISLPHTKYAIAVYYLCATAEASSNLARYDGVHYGTRVKGCENIIDMYTRTRSNFGDEVKRRIMLGTFALSAGFYDAYYLKSLRVRTLIQRDFQQAFEKVDLIATPVSPVPAFKVGEKTADPLSMYLADIFTISLNLIGYGGMSVPCGFTSAGLPVGLQLITPPFEEARMLRAAYAYEQSAEWKLLRPIAICV
ncbi:MAG: Asp-tRNA(Asn)/Glu-tRNA(Gln) amidotransferase subunit GatA [Candidatus Sumerlaeota bacterium]|nr:Asp-tRNA(Asn)/Glu-tRNA(Gln) amidotransferase subunit GatA [Candidatus Sumerlaeota bacterium]